jgi:hypothetical protein
MFVPCFYSQLCTEEVAATTTDHHLLVERRRSSSSASTTRSTSRPNVVLIVSDGVRQGDVSFMKQYAPEAKEMVDTFRATPTLNALAEKGIVFESLYATGQGSSSSSMFMAGRSNGDRRDEVHCI